MLATHAEARLSALVSTSVRRLARETAARTERETRSLGLPGALLFALSASFLALAVFVTTIARGPLATLSASGSDHASHVGVTILSRYHGLDVYRRPVGELCPLHDDASRALERTLDVRAEDRALITVCNIPQRAGQRPLFLNWPRLVRPYPPGLWLLTLPEAWLYEETSISFRALNKLSILKYLFFAHVLTALAHRVFFHRSIVGRARWFSIAAVALVHCEGVRWALCGFYDVVAVAALFCALRHALDERPAHAFGAWSIALFLHFRALWLLPMAVVLAHRALRRGSAIDRLIVLATLPLVSASMIAFAAVFPHLGSFPESNPVFIGTVGSHIACFVAWSSALALVAGWLAKSGRWLTAATLVWQAVMLGRTPQMQAWHALFLLPMLGVSCLEGMTLTAAMVMSVFYVTQTILVFGAPNLPWLVEQIARGRA